MKLFKKENFLIVSFFFIIITSLLGGCNVDVSVDKEAITKAKNTNEQKLLDSRAMKDDFASQFLSINPKEKDYLTFTSGTKGYKMLFHKDSIISNTLYEVHNKSFENVVSYLKYPKENLMIEQETTYYDYSVGEDLDFLLSEIEQFVDRKNIKQYENKEYEYYIANLLKKEDGINYNYFYAVIHSKKINTKSISLTGYARCINMKKSCDAEDKKIEKHFNKIIRSFEF